MNKDIEWKKTDLDYEKLNKINHKDIQSSIILKKYRRPDLGGKANTSESQSVKGKANTSESQSEKNKKRKTFGHSSTTKIGVYISGTDEFFAEYTSISECARNMKLDKGNIHKVIIGVYKQHKGYYFKKII
jgi:hypothetical protein